MTDRLLRFQISSSLSHKTNNRIPLTYSSQKTPPKVRHLLQFRPQSCNIRIQPINSLSFFLFQKHQFNLLQLILHSRRRNPPSKNGWKIISLLRKRKFSFPSLKTGNSIYISVLESWYNPNPSGLEVINNYFVWVEKFIVILKT